MRVAASRKGFESGVSSPVLPPAARRCGVASLAACKPQCVGIAVFKIFLPALKERASIRENAFLCAADCGGMVRWHKAVCAGAAAAGGCGLPCCPSCRTGAVSLGRRGKILNPRGRSLLFRPLRGGAASLRLLCRPSCRTGAVSLGRRGKILNPRGRFLLFVCFAACAASLRLLRRPSCRTGAVPLGRHGKILNPRGRSLLFVCFFSPAVRRGAASLCSPVSVSALPPVSVCAASLGSPVSVFALPPVAVCAASLGSPGRDRFDSCPPAGQQQTRPA